jgi:hypothetical protein
LIFGGEQGDFGMRFNFLERGIHGYYPFNRPLKDRLNLADDGDVIYLLEESDLDWATPPPLTQRQQGLTRRFRQLINTANQQLARNLSALTSQGARPLLTPRELRAATYVPAALYGRALERLVARRVRNDPILSKHLRYTGQGSGPDFRGKRGSHLQGVNFELTTRRARADHVRRRYPNTRIYTYRRPSHLGF